MMLPCIKKNLWVSNKREKCIGAEFTHICFISPQARKRNTLKKCFQDSATPIQCIDPEELVVTLDVLDPGPTTTENTVRGYKVKIKRQSLSPEEAAKKRAAIAEVLAKSLGKVEKRSDLPKVKYLSNSRS